MGNARKIWVAVSDVDAHRPDDFMTFIAESDEDIDEGIELGRDFCKNDLALEVEEDGEYE